MLKSALGTLALVFAFVLQSVAETTITPTTTLAAETGNNTSGADAFATSTNGNVAPQNVSKESIRKLLYAGSTSKIYAHYLGWWGSTSHINIGYDAATFTQAHKQISDMISRGIDGLIIDWYGTGNTHINQASLYIKQDAETRGGKFTFAIMEDQGAVRTCAYTAGCNVTQKVIDDLNYINSTYASSPAYMRINGQPVIFTFDTENLPNIDWTKVMASVQGNPKIVLRNDQGFKISYTSGSYAWVAINKANQSDWGQNYLVDFYWNSRNYPNELVYPGVWKGFDDTAASWSENRIMSQNCGQTWLNTFAEMNKAFSTAIQAPAVQLVTWNDYEEGTEIETGIENCVSVSGSVSGSTLYWTIGGQENTIDHYSIFISQDGQNLMKLTDVEAGIHQLSLASYGLSPSNYTLYVKAVGQPSMVNHMSGAIPVTLGNLPPVVALSVTPTSGTGPVTVSADTTASTDTDGSITSTRIDFGDGTVLTAATGSHTYSTPGAYTITATVTDNSNATASANSTVTVKGNQAPVAAISVTPATGTAPVTVTASVANSTDADGTIASSTIDFGDGTVANGPTASHTYNTAGTFTVTGTVKDNGGLATTTTASVSIAAPLAPFAVKVSSPAADASITGPVRFTATTTSPSTVTAVRIYVDNQSMYTVNSASIDQTLTLKPGSHFVVMQAWNQQGQVAKTPLNITVQNAIPVATLVVTPNSAMAPAVVSATANGSDLDGSIAATSIDFGDGTVVNTPSATHTYSVAGTYTVTAKVTDNNGATAVAKSPVSIAPLGIVVRRPSRGSIVPNPVAITATAAAATPIVAMRAYVDNKAVYSLNSFSQSIATLDTNLTMNRGLHYIVVQAWDSKGKVYKTPVSIIVQ